MNRVWNFVSFMTAGMVFTRRAGTSPQIHLSFDDGPHPEHTPPLLELLARHDARATFFMLGARLAPHRSLAQQICAAGHTLGNHSYSHASFVSISMEQQAREIDQTDALLAEIDGHPQHLFRPPRGRPGLSTLALCAQRRRSIALWTHDSRDFALDESQVIASMSAKNIVAGDILLFHDDGPVALGALETLLPLWRDQGLGFAAL